MNPPKCRSWLTLILSGVALIGVTPGSSRAMFIEYKTPTGSTQGGLPVNAVVDFTTSSNTITVVLKNLQADPSSVVQNLSDLSFTVSTGQNTGTLSSSSGQERTVNSGGTFTDGATVSTGWVLTTQGSGFLLNVLGTATGPAHTIIGGPNAGTGTYAAAGGSIAGNGPHNPFLNQSATFVITANGVTADSVVNSATFSFGTTAGNNTPGVAVPEPASMLSLGLGALSLAAGRLLRKRAKAAVC